MSKRADREDALTRGRKLREALDCHAAGVDLMRQNLRRRHPEESREEIQERLVRWMHERPGAEHGDGPGRIIEWPVRR